jgi:hypothetical protein
MKDTSFFWLVLLTKMTIMTKCSVVHLVKKEYKKNGPLKCPWPSQISHIKWPCLVKLTILIWLVSLLVCLLGYLLAYLPNTYLFINNLPSTYRFILNMSYLFIYLSIYLLISYLFIYLPTYILTYNLHK